MSAAKQQYRLDGLVPDNLLAFLALLGLLRSLEEVEPSWQSRVAWTVDAPPIRPLLTLARTTGTGRDEIVAAAAAGLNRLAERHDFAPHKNLRLLREAATERLRAASTGDRYTADLWAALGQRRRGPGAQQDHGGGGPLPSA